MTSTLSTAVQFFYDHAGYSWNQAAGQSEEAGHLETAQNLAMAEQAAQERGWVVQWTEFDDGDHSYTDQPEFDGCEVSTCEVAILDDGDGETLASLCCIDDADDNYRRVVDAQLALEAINSNS